jgi:hypothetical protein
VIIGMYSPNAEVGDGMLAEDELAPEAADSSAAR